MHQANAAKYSSHGFGLRTDGAHLALMALALGMAYVLPFELFVLAYAVLGPAHYLTEISWLHDRRYFLPHRSIAAGLVLVAFAAMFMADTFWLGIVVSFTFVACAILALARFGQRVWFYLAASAAFFCVLGLLNTPFRVAWVLLPTLIHVSVFTLLFVLLGAIRSKRPSQFILFGAYLVAVTALLLLPPSSRSVLPQISAIGKEYFGDIAPALGLVLGIPDLTFDARITGLLSFAYTYHYLNWFIKVDVIQWNAVPTRRLVAIGVLSVAATSLYFYNYAIGFMVLLLLSLIHVLLEFPLNSLCIRQLLAAAGRNVGGTSSTPTRASA